MQSYYLMSNLIIFYHRDRQGKGFLLKLMQYEKILPYIHNSLRSISVIIRALYRNLNSSARK